MKTILTYEAAIAYIHDTNKFASKLGLENIRALLDRLGNPQDDLRFVHVAGTNGKGSTTAFISYALKAQGYRVGTYTSPFLQQFNERIQINHEPISDKSLAIHTTAVKEAIDDMVAAGLEHPTEFEIVTAIGFEYFKAQGVDVVVLEVGLGGRLDSTNIISNPLACVITPIALDHVQYLGDTIEKIAFEKAGIIKNDSIVVCASQSLEAINVIKTKATQTKSMLIISDSNLSVISKMSLDGTEFSYKEHAYTIGLLGAHQIQNACTAIDTLIALTSSGGIHVSMAAIEMGLKEAQWAGRFEIVHKDPTLIIDGAHNAHGVKALREAILTYNPTGKRIAIFGMMADKDVKEVLGSVHDLFDVFYTVEPNNPRAMTHGDIHKVLVELNFSGPIYPLSKIDLVRDLMASEKETNPILYSFGSLYYIGEVRSICLEK